MNPSDSLRIDDYLARLLAAYDPGMDGVNAKAPTVELVSDKPDSRVRSDHSPIVNRQLDEGSLGDVLPDSHLNEPFLHSMGHNPFANTAVGPHRIGRFELRRQLGRGGCGIVFLAYDPTLKREVAIKIPRPDLLMSADARRRLIREAYAAAEFDHPNLVPVYETGEIGPVCYLATAFCPGKTLAEWLDRQAFPVPVRQAARLIAQIAEAIQHAHDRGVLHRDLKPNNIILQEIKGETNDQGPLPGSCPLRGEQFIPRVVDFGLAKLAEQGPSETMSKQVLGTPKYMAPEQAQGLHDDVGPRADVYALGVMLYELLVGRVPFEGASDVEILRLAVEGKATQPRELREEIPRDLEAICQKAMNRNRAKRYRSAIDLGDDLRRFLDGKPTLARPLNRIGRAARWLRRNDQLFALIVVSAIVLILFPIGTWGIYQTGKLREAQSITQKRDADRMKLDIEREYARNVRDAFLSWRAGDAQQMTESLANARYYMGSGEKSEFAWRYLSRLGRVERLSIAMASKPVRVLATAPDGKRIATGHEDGTLILWNIDSGSRIASVKTHNSPIGFTVFLAPNLLVTASIEGKARVWLVGPRDELRAVGDSPTLPAEITAMTISADAKLIYLGCAGGQCLVWNIAENRIVRNWCATAKGPVIALAVSSDWTIATVGQGEPVRLWNGGMLAPAVEIRGAAGATVLAFVASVSGGLLLAAAGEERGVIRLFDRQGREVRSLLGHTGAVLALASSPDGSSIASGGIDSAVCVWDVATGSPRALLRGHDQPVRGVRFGSDGQTVCSVSDDGFLKVWDLVADPEGQSVRNLPSAISSLAIHPDERGFAIAYADGSVEIYARRGEAPRRFPPNGRGPMASLDFSTNGTVVGVEMAGGSVVVWAFATQPRELHRATLPIGSVATVAELSTDAEILAVGSDRGRVTTWSLKKPLERTSFETGLASPVRHIAISDDGQLVAAPTTGYAIGIWTIGGESPAHRVAGHGEGLWLLQFLPGGTRLATTGRGSSIKVWDVKTGQEEVSLLGHVGRVTALAISANGETMASGSATGEVKVWDLRTSQELIGLRRHSGPIAAAAFSPRANLLLTGGITASGRGELVFWDGAE